MVILISVSLALNKTIISMFRDEICQGCCNSKVGLDLFKCNYGGKKHIIYTFTKILGLGAFVGNFIMVERDNFVIGNADIN